jgi:Tfp pilus assembly protein PilO
MIGSGSRSLRSSGVGSSGSGALGSMWRRRLGLWLPALLFFLLNVGAFLLYRSSYADKTAGLEGRIRGREGELASLRERSDEVARLVGQANQRRDQLQELYRDRFSTRRERLTQIIEEVRELADQAGLEPQAISYPEEEIAGYALVERSFVFNVEGSYQQLRRFVNFMELSPSFLALRKIQMAGDPGAPGADLRINLTLSTLFADETLAGTAGEGES